MECMEICTKHTNYRIHCDDDGWALGVSNVCIKVSMLTETKTKEDNMSKFIDNPERSQLDNVH